MLHLTSIKEYFCKKWYILDLCVSSLRRGHANLLCIVPIFADDLPKKGPREKRQYCC